MGSKSESDQTFTQSDFFDKYHPWAIIALGLLIGLMIALIVVAIILGIILTPAPVGTATAAVAVTVAVSVSMGTKMGLVGGSAIGLGLSVIGVSITSGVAVLITLGRAVYRYFFPVKKKPDDPDSAPGVNPTPTSTQAEERKPEEQKQVGDTLSINKKMEEEKLHLKQQQTSQQQTLLDQGREEATQSTENSENEHILHSDLNATDEQGSNDSWKKKKSKFKNNKLTNLFKNKDSKPETSEESKKMQNNRENKKSRIKDKNKIESLVGSQSKHSNSSGKK